MYRFPRILAPALALILLATACTTLKQPSQKIDFYTLEYAPPQGKELKPLSVAIRIERFSVAPLYNTHQMIYRDRSFKREPYLYHKWRANPGDLVTYFLVRDLRESGLFKAIAPEGSKIASPYVLEGSVDEFFEWDSEDAWKAVLTISTTLVVEGEPDISKRIIFQQTFATTKPCKQKNPLGLAEAMSEAMAEVSQEVIKSVYRHLNNRQ